MMKKLLAVVLTVAMVISMAACNKGTKGQTIEVAHLYTGDSLEAFKVLVEKFTEETGIKVNLSDSGDDYEAMMKTRMASNKLPDVFQTHGWSIIRYKEYLMKLNDQSWFKDLDESALGVISDEDGSVYVLMISELINGTLVNIDVCEAAGVDYTQIHTWDDFTAACEKIKAAGYTPLGVNPNPGVLANYAGTWTTYKGAYAEDGEAQLNGTWDWKSYGESCLKQHAEWVSAGYYYEDAPTMADTDLSERFAANKAAFINGNDPGVFVKAKTYNPDGRYAFMPSFASADGAEEFVGIGEGDTFGIWKDTKHEEAAKAFLEFMARPENAIAINNITAKISCLKSTMAIDESDGLAYFKEMKETCKNCNIRYENLWDRKYMPSGMWSIFGNACGMLFDDPSEAGQAAVLDYLKTNYDDLYAAAQNK